MSDLVLPGGGDLARPGGLYDFTEAWLRNRRLSEHTRDAYRLDIRLWATWCADNDVDPLRATFVHVNQWAREMEERGGAAPSTVRRRLAGVSSWYSYLLKLGAIPVNPAAAADRPYVDRDYSTTVAFTAADASRMLRLSGGDRVMGECGRPLAYWLVDLGTRVSETCALDVTDLGHHLGHRVVTFLGKGGRPHRRAIPPHLSHQLDLYLAGRQDGPLFVTADGERINRFQVYRFVQRLAEAAGVPDARRITPHSFRTAFATTASAKGVPLENIQDAMGHADPRTTRRYQRNRHRLDADPAFVVAAAVSEPPPDDTAPDLR